MKSGNKVIRKRLLFGEACRLQLQENFNGLLLKGDKTLFGKIVMGNGKIKKKKTDY